MCLRNVYSMNIREQGPAGRGRDVGAASHHAKRAQQRLLLRDQPLPRPALPGEQKAAGEVPEDLLHAVRGQPVLLHHRRADPGALLQMW